MQTSPASAQRGHGGVLRAVLFGMALSLTVAAGCVKPPGPGLIDELREADLREKRPQAVKQGGDSAKDAPRRFETYPGDDQFREQTAASAGKRKAGPTAVQRTGDGYQLSFDNASIAEVAKVILGDTLKAPYYYDPRVQGQVTLATGRSVTREELLSVLETALKMNNAVLINGDGQYRVAPAAEALAGDVGSVVGEGVPGFGVSVLPLRNVSAEAMMRLIENFVAKAGSLKAESTGNLLMIRGTARERQSLMEVASSFDVDWLKSQSAGIFPLTHSTPDEMIAELTQAMNAEEGELLGKMVRFQPLQRLNAVLVLARQSSQLKQAAEWIRRLDRSNEAGQDLHVYRVENGRAADLANLLNETLGTGAGGGTRRGSRDVAPGREVSRLSSRATRPPTGGPLSAPGGGQRSSQLQPALAPQARRQSEEPSSGPPPLPSAPGQGPGGAAPPAIRITADEVNNLLLINASPAEYRRIANVLREIDRPPLQVMINATIVEVTLNDSLRYGVQVFLKGKNIAGGVSAGAGADPLGPLTPISPNNIGLNLLIGSLTDPKIVVDALADVTEVKVVSSPSVVVVDNQPAILKVGDEIPIKTQQTTVLDGGGNTVDSFQYRDTGVILKVIPRVNSTGLVTMDVEQEVSQVAQNSVGSTTPTVSQRQVASTISVYSGQMVALGGLISEQRDNDRTSVPIINQIPLFGDLLGTTGKALKRTELIVFIRPQVIRDSRDARNVAEELRSRLKSLAPPPPPSADSWRTHSAGTRR